MINNKQKKSYGCRRSLFTSFHPPFKPTKRTTSDFPRPTIIFLMFLWLHCNNYSTENLKLRHFTGADTTVWSFQKVYICASEATHKRRGLCKSSNLLPWHLYIDEQAHSLCCFSENTHSHKKAVSFLARKRYPWIASLYFLVSSTVVKRRKKINRREKKKEKRSSTSFIL